MRSIGRSVKGNLEGGGGAANGTGPRRRICDRRDVQGLKVLRRLLRPCFDVARVARALMKHWSLLCADR